MSKPLPKKLEDALKNQPKYKQVHEAPESVLSSILNSDHPSLPSSNVSSNSAYSFERNLLDKLGRDHFTAATTDIASRDGGGGGSLFPKRPPRNNAQELARSREESLLYSHNKAVVGADSATVINPDNSARRDEQERATVASMAIRLNQLEKSSRDLRQELVLKEKEVFRLKKRNEVLELTIGRANVNEENTDHGNTDQNMENTNRTNMSNEQEASTLSSLKKKLHNANDTARRALDETMSLKTENIQLKMKIKEMEIFLADYGLTWRGAAATDDQLLRPSSSTKSKTQGVELDIDNTSNTLSNDVEGDGLHSSGRSLVDIDLVIEKVEELNTLVANTGPRLVVEGNKAKYEFDTERIRLTLYGDGLNIDGKGNRKYSEESTAAFIKDVIDGYFPSEFKDQYPEGVHIQCSDKRHEMVFLNSFSGSGNVLGSKSASMALAGVGGREFNHSLTTPTKSPRRPRSGGGGGGDSGGGRESDQEGKEKSGIGLQELYRKLPPDVKILRGGQIVDIRSEIGQKLEEEKKKKEAESRQIKNENSGALLNNQNAIDSSVDKSSEFVDDESELVTTVRVRLPRGKAVVFRLPFHQTVSHLHELVASKADLSLNSFELRTSFPNKSYEVEAASGMSLEDAKLVPSAVLILRELK